MILEAILVLTGVAALGSVVNIFMKNREAPQESISIKKYMPGDLPVITLTNNGVALNFLIDTGSNISHICPSAHCPDNNELYNMLQKHALYCQ